MIFFNQSLIYFHTFGHYLVQILSNILISGLDVLIPFELKVNFTVSTAWNTGETVDFHLFHNLLMSNNQILANRGPDSWFIV